jgi:hypothetical protein
MLVVTVGLKSGDDTLGSLSWSALAKNVEECVGVWEKLGPPDSRSFGETDFGDGSVESCTIIWFEHRVMSGGTDKCLEILARERGVRLAYGLAESFFV